MRTLNVLAIPLVIAGLACTAGPPAETSTWVGTISTADGVTTVVNESGSVWGGTARLVEEASIGAESGAEEYLFGYVSFVYATDQLIWVVDDQAAAVRAYDHDGNYVRTFGRRGQGPGEYDYPGAVAVDDSGRVFVRDNRHARINVYAADGQVLDAWPKPVSVCCLPMYPLPGDALWTSVFLDRPGGGVLRGAQAVGPDGPIGEPIGLPEIEYDQATYLHPRGRESMTPFSPYLTWTMAPGGRILAGASDRYRFGLYGPEGAELIVERYWSPVPVAAEHKEWARRLQIATERDINSADISLTAAQIPDHQPAFSSLIPALSGEIWVSRAGESGRLPECAGDPLVAGYRPARARPCWESAVIVDAFDAAGRYLGELEIPDGVELRVTAPFIDGDRVIAVRENEAGTIMVKRYRLIPPGDGAGRP